MHEREQRVTREKKYKAEEGQLREDRESSLALERHALELEAELDGLMPRRERRRATIELSRVRAAIEHRAGGAVPVEAAHDDLVHRLPQPKPARTSRKP